MNLFRQVHKRLDALPVLSTLLDGASMIEYPFRRIAEGPDVRFELAAEGISGKDVQRLLEDFGITIYDYGIVGGRIVFRVRVAQAQWAEYLLQKEGWA